MPLRPELLTLISLRGAALAPGVGRVSDTGLVWLAALLTAVWVNVHPGAMVAPGIVFLHLLGRRLQWSPEAEPDCRTRPTWRHVFGCAGCGRWALGLNPWGFQVVALPLRIRAALADLPASNPDWQRLWDDPPHHAARRPAISRGSSAFGCADEGSICRLPSSSPRRRG